MFPKLFFVTSLVIGFAVGLGAGTSEGRVCAGAVTPPNCVQIDNSGAHEDYRVSNNCPHAVTLYFDVHESGDDWKLDPTNFAAVFGYLNVQPGDTGESGIRYDAQATIHCCPEIAGVSCSGEATPEKPN